MTNCAVVFVFVLVSSLTVGAFWPFKSGERPHPETHGEDDSTMTTPLPIPAGVQAIAKWRKDENGHKLTIATVTDFFDGGAVGATLSSCIAKAATQLPSRCVGMSDSDFSYFAISLTNCHLAKSKRPTHFCPRGAPISTCTSGMTDAVFGIYTTFYSQSLALCMQLQHDIRDIAAQETMNMLILASDRTASQVKALGHHSEALLREVGRSREALDTHFDITQRRFSDLDGAINTTAFEQRRVAEEGMLALTNIVRTTEDISHNTRESLDGLIAIYSSQKSILESVNGLSIASSLASERAAALVIQLDSLEQRSSAMIKGQIELLIQQRELSESQQRMREAQMEFAKSLDVVVRIQRIIFGTVIDIKTVIWYVSMTILCSIITVPEITRRGRPWILCGLVALLGIERLVTCIGLKYLFYVYVVVVMVYHVVSSFRGCVMAVATSEVDHGLLLSIQDELREMRKITSMKTTRTTRNRKVLHGP
jgi:hypothetical protein